MSSPFIGEIRMFAGNFAPVGWAFCNGAIMPIDQNDALFNLIGTTYGGDGQTTFALPNLQSRVPVHVGPGFALGQAGGAESVTLITSQLPPHSHAPPGCTNPTSPPAAPRPPPHPGDPSNLNQPSTDTPQLRRRRKGELRSAYSPGALSRACRQRDCLGRARRRNQPYA